MIYIFFIPSFPSLSQFSFLDKTSWNFSHFPPLTAITRCGTMSPYSPHATSITEKNKKYLLVLKPQDIEFLSVTDFNTRDLSE